MALFDELEAEASAVPVSKQSQIDVFLDALDEKDRADVDAWIASGRNKRALYRVLKRHGLPVAESTFRNWAINSCR